MGGTLVDIRVNIWAVLKLLAEDGANTAVNLWSKFRVNTMTVSEKQRYRRNSVLSNSYATLVLFYGICCVIRRLGHTELLED